MLIALFRVGFSPTSLARIDFFWESVKEKIEKLGITGRQGEGRVAARLISAYPIVSTSHTMEAPRRDATRTPEQLSRWHPGTAEIRATSEITGCA
jgi:hypothetical protein